MSTEKEKLRQRPPRYAVYERIDAMNAKPDSIILGEFKTFEMAEEARKQYGFTSDNYYVKEC